MDPFDPEIDDRHPCFADATIQPWSPILSEYEEETSANILMEHFGSEFYEDMMTLSLARVDFTKPETLLPHITLCNAILVMCHEDSQTALIQSFVQDFTSANIHDEHFSQAFKSIVKHLAVYSVNSAKYKCKTSQFIQIAVACNLDRLFKTMYRVIKSTQCECCMRMFSSSENLFKVCERGYPELLRIIVSIQPIDIYVTLQNALARCHPSLSKAYMRITDRGMECYDELRRQPVFKRKMLWDRNSIDIRQFRRLIKYHMRYNHLHPNHTIGRKNCTRLTPNHSENYIRTSNEPYKYSRVWYLVRYARKFDYPLNYYDQDEINTVAYPKVVFPNLRHPVLKGCDEVVAGAHILRPLVVKEFDMTTGFSTAYWHLFFANLYVFRENPLETEGQYKHSWQKVMKSIYKLYTHKHITFELSWVSQFLRSILRKDPNYKILGEDCDDIFDNLVFAKVCKKFYKTS